ncbi:DUF2784 domain-containing protein [Pandoraea sp.]|uniref:DUF2784 domain-containing protein n=1 Tax=Pandoraea sp. TaxID=1883445 RepID=UPI001206495A|nr:DUF2784 domain-containing protein [Pandoraea sp.]TAL52795.1 MAG: DUF2784 domain-containing protein [Pandoraea sp.]TAM15908.1 MAG: DUF2784 domain-containing protein [Pandoraea sp.]
MTGLANVVLVLHALIALFIVGSLAMIWIGAALRWAWVRQPLFRLVHLLAIGTVALLALAGLPCPLTVLEDHLRQGAMGQAGFIQYWVSRLLYYQFPPWVFTVAYAAFAMLAALTWHCVPPRRRCATPGP